MIKPCRTLVYRILAGISCWTMLDPTSHSLAIPLWGTTTRPYHRLWDRRVALRSGVFWQVSAYIIRDTCMSHLSISLSVYQSIHLPIYLYYVMSYCIILIYFVYTYIYTHIYAYIHRLYSTHTRLHLSIVTCISVDQRYTPNPPSCRGGLNCSPSYVLPGKAPRISLMFDHCTIQNLQATVQVEQEEYQPAPCSTPKPTTIFGFLRKPLDRTDCWGGLGPVTLGN